MNEFEELEAKIQKARQTDAPSPQQIQKSVDESNSRAGIQAGIELVGSIGAGALIGLGLDHWLGTKPAFFLIMFFVGICTGFYNVYRVTQGLGSAVGFSQLHKGQKDAKSTQEKNRNKK